MSELDELYRSAEYHVEQWKMNSKWKNIAENPNEIMDWVTRMQRVIPSSARWKDTPWEFIVLACIRSRAADMAGGHQHIYGRDGLPITDLRLR